MVVTGKMDELKNQGFVEAVTKSTLMENAFVVQWPNTWLLTSET